MPPRHIDPAPRKYAAHVTLVDRLSRSPQALPASQTMAEIEAWLLGDAIRMPDMHRLFEEFVWRMVVSGQALDRASLHVGTLHPQVYGFAWNWNVADGFCDEVKVAEEALASDAYLRSPLATVLNTGAAVSLHPIDAELAARSPLAADLLALGITHYIAIPLGGAGYHNVATIATRREGGFSDAERTAIERLLRVFAIHVERHIAARIARNVLDTYLGASAGRQVLDGSIKRGAGSRIGAVIWLSDLRGFTDLSDRLLPADMLSVINAYFEAMVQPIIGNGGEILKFMGDGLLAVFPHAGDYAQANAAEAAVASAQAAEEAVSRLNKSPPASIASIAGWQQLRSGIALHDGEVFFGNLGSPERLDFTVLGQAVNTASRVEAMSKALGRSILLTGPVARALARPTESLGSHMLRGMTEPVEIFGLS